jgi:hypothetical protein
VRVCSVYVVIAVCSHPFLIGVWLHGRPSVTANIKGRVSLIYLCLPLVYKRIDVLETQITGKV